MKPVLKFDNFATPTNGFNFDAIFKAILGSPSASARHLVNVQASDNYKTSKGVYKLQIQIPDVDPLQGLPAFANTTLKCLVLKINTTIDSWEDGNEPRMIDYGLCLAKKEER